MYWKLSSAGQSMIEKKSKKTIGRYEIVAKIAQGGMSAVFKAKHPTLNRFVLLKKLTLRGGSQFTERFKREARLMMDFKHEHIVQVYDHFKEGSSYYIVEEFVDGTSLDELIKKERYLSNEAALLILYEVSKALAYAHEKQVIHRDIKPGNILISKNGEVKLVDFGIATSQEESEDGLTREGMILGTPSYIPPEQISDAKNADKRADIYSLGVVLYEMLTGKTPFPGSFNAETIALIHKGKYTPPGRINPRISPTLRRIIRKAMRPKPAHRFQDIKRIIRLLEKRIRRREPAEIRAAIKRMLAGGDIREITRRKASPLIKLLAALLAAAALGAGGAVAWRRGIYYDLLAPDDYGALVVAARIAAAGEDPENITVSALLYREEEGELVLQENVSFGFREIREDPEAADYVLESRRLFLPAGKYRLKLNLEGRLFWQSFFLAPRTLQREHLSSAAALRLEMEPGPSLPLPLTLSATVRDIATGADLTAGSSLFLFRGGRWQPWSRELAAALTSGAAYRFRFEHEGYHAQHFNLRVLPEQSRLEIRAALVPLPGTLRLSPAAPGLRLKLNGSDSYLTGGTARELRRLPPPGEQETKLVLDPGSYLVTVQRDERLSRTLAVDIAPGRSLGISIRYDKTEDSLELDLEE
jgi:tRNA A-37 threonylcarbamoyl transferase component Bud32